MDKVLFEILNSPYGASSTTLIFFLLAVWVFRKSLLGIIEREVKKDVEEFKQELDTKREIIKHELNTEAHKGLYLSTSIQEIYPEIYKSMLLSEGGLGGFLGLRELPDWNTFTAKQVETLLKDKEFHEDEIVRLVGLFSSGDTNRKDELQSSLDLHSLSEIRGMIREAKNYFLLKSLFISTSVKEAVDGLFTELWSVWCDLETWLRYGRATSGINITDVRRKQEELISLIENMEKKMREELFPS